MAKVTLTFAVLLIVLGLTGYLGTGSQYPTAMIPTWIGLALGVSAYLSISPKESRRKLFMHTNVTIAALGFIGAIAMVIRGFIHDSSSAVNWAAQYSKVTLAALLLIYIILCVRSFRKARLAGKV
jgi:uncharacterized membrane protein (UPF0136 family)